MITKMLFYLINEEIGKISFPFEFGYAIFVAVSSPNHTFYQFLCARIKIVLELADFVMQWRNQNAKKKLRTSKGDYEIEQ